MRRAAQRVRPPADTGPLRHEYAFLVGTRIDRATLERAEAKAAQVGVPTHAVLIAAGWLSARDYAAELAQALDAEPAYGGMIIDAAGTAGDATTPAGLGALVQGRSCRIVEAAHAAPAEIAARIAALKAHGHHVALASLDDIDAACERRWRNVRLDRAVRGLLRDRPELSAGSRTRSWQIALSTAIIGGFIGGAAILPEATLAVLTGLLSLPFLCVTLLRLAALREALGRSVAVARRANRRLPRLPDHLLPTYSILVPLLREANVLAGLVRALRALDYPPARLDIILVLESNDYETRAAVQALKLPGNFRTLVVPLQQPQTKPKALNYALQVARGDFVVVYDAEDRPEAGQLRRALDAFRTGGPKLACVQARLNIYNPYAGFLTRQFTIEYSILFDAILPALQRLRLPVPLGGTSNHFPRAVLEQAGAWDPFNVTEDADLGIRLARRGLRTVVLTSTTWEEAPVRCGSWVRQRTRWLKGWMQTYLVHTRRPWRLLRELGLVGTLGFHVVMGGLILSALVHPVFYALLIHAAIAGNLLEPSETGLGATMWTIACINLGVGYGVSILVGMIGVWRRGRARLTLSVLLMPLYWLLISLAAYRALWQLIRSPYLWEKTDHGPRRRKRR